MGNDRKTYEHDYYLNNKEQFHNNYLKSKKNRKVNFNNLTDEEKELSRLKKNASDRKSYHKNKLKANNKKQIKAASIKANHIINREVGNYVDIIITKKELESMPDINCSNCKTDRQAKFFYIRSKKKENGSIENYIDAKCKFCNLNKDKKWYLQDNIIVEQFISQKNKITQSRENNQDLTPSQKKSLYKRNKIKTNSCFKLRENVSRAINGMLKRNSSRKNGGSVMDFLNYSFDELKIHLENQFAEWMSWENWGPYNTDHWRDEDPATWTWNIDHIIPHSMFKYTNMNCIEFQTCWALNNLRPYSAKQNILDGASKVRHIEYTKLNNNQVISVDDKTYEPKQCSKCRTVKHLNSFGLKNRKTKRGVVCKTPSMCKKCINEYAKNMRKSK